MCLGAMAAGSLGVGGLGKYAYDQRKERKKLQNEVKETRLENEKIKTMQNTQPAYFSDKSASKAPTTNTSQRQY